jgi:predicted transposase YbfD/YdcC
MNNPLKYFSELRDPRVERTREHLLEEILLMSIAAVLSGAGSWIEKSSEWVSLQGLVRIESERYHKATAKTEREIRYYITSLRPNAARLNSVIRQHGGIENKLHWALDVSFGEDLDRKRTGHAAQSFSLINRIALNMLKQDKTCKLGIKGKRLKAGWDNDYLLQILGN